MFCVASMIVRAIFGLWVKSPTCDLWSVGEVAYILLTSYPPFNGCNDLEVHVSIRLGFEYVAFDDNIWGNLSRQNQEISFVCYELKKLKNI